MMRSRLVKLLVLLALAAGFLVLSTQADANPPGIPAGWHKAYQFNMIGYPAGQEYTGGCGQGNRVFVNRDAHNARMLVTDGGSWDITDCNATADNTAEMTTNEAGRYAVFVRILGQPGGHLHICADTYEDYTAGETLCLLGTIDLTRGHGQSRFSMAPSTMFDASLEDIVWQIETNPEFRIAQFRVYELP
jgi:hypothetical protein